MDRGDGETMNRNECFWGGTSAKGWGDDRLIPHGATGRASCTGQPGTGFLMLTSSD